MVSDHYIDKFKKLPWIDDLDKYRTYPDPSKPIAPNWPPVLDPVTRSEFEQLRKDLEEMKELLKKAMEYDKRTNQPHCEKQENIEIIKNLADALGVDLSEIDFHV